MASPCCGAASGVPSCCAAAVRGARVGFVLQYFLNDVIIQHAGRLASCADTLGLRWHLLVHEDDGEPSHISRWAEALRPYGTNATLVSSRNIHELRGYNMGARILQDSELLVFLQDDDVPPRSCGWLEASVGAFAVDERLGALGLRRGALSGDWAHEVHLHGRPSLGQSPLCHPGLGLPARYVMAVDLAPMVLRRAAFDEADGFPTFLTPAGTRPARTLPLRGSVRLI